MLPRKVKNLCAHSRGDRRRPVTTAAVRPTLDVLEDRTVPSAVVADFYGSGLSRYDPNSQTWQQINGYDASAMAVDAITGNVVATFPGFGTALWKPGASGWQVLTGAEATLLSISGSGQQIAGEFPGAGVWAFHSNTGWLHLTFADASSLATDGAGNVVGEFPGNGVWFFSGPANTWTKMTAADASQVVLADVGFVIGEFPGNGVWADHFGGNWVQLTTVDADSLAGAGGAGGMAAASFYDYGTYAYVVSTGSWILTTSSVVDALATDGADFAGIFSADYCPFTSYYGYGSGQWQDFDSSGATLLGVSVV